MQKPDFLATQMIDILTLLVKAILSNLKVNFTRFSFKFIKIRFNNFKQTKNETELLKRNS